MTRIETDAGGCRSGLKTDRPKTASRRQTFSDLSLRWPENPADVQLWHGDSSRLEGLIAKLKKKPGIHAVHLIDDEPHMTRPRVN